MFMNLILGGDPNMPGGLGAGGAGGGAGHGAHPPGSI